MYGVCPEVNIEGNTELTFLFVVPHLEYMLLEVMKNALRAVVEHHRKTSTFIIISILSSNSSNFVSSLAGFSFPDLPPVVVRICAGVSEVTIKVSDQGGGIPKQNLDKVFQYGFTTMKSVDETKSGLGMIGTTVEEIHSPMAGLGFGLPLTRCAFFSRLFHLSN